MAAGGSAGGHLAACAALSSKLVGEPHGFFNRAPWRERTLVAVDKFLVSLGYLQGESTIKAP